MSDSTTVWSVRLEIEFGIEFWEVGRIDQTGRWFAPLSFVHRQSPSRARAHAYEACARLNKGQDPFIY